MGPTWVLQSYIKSSIFISSKIAEVVGLFIQCGVQIWSIRTAFASNTHKWYLVIHRWWAMSCGIQDPSIDYCVLMWPGQPISKPRGNNWTGMALLNVLYSIEFNAAGQFARTFWAMTAFSWLNVNFFFCKNILFYSMQVYRHDRITIVLAMQWNLVLNLKVIWRYPSRCKITKHLDHILRKMICA